MSVLKIGVAVVEGIFQSMSITAFLRSVVFPVLFGLVVEIGGGRYSRFVGDRRLVGDGCPDTSGSFSVINRYDCCEEDVVGEQAFG